LLALAGIPLTSGFIGKFVVFSAALSDGMAPLVVIALVASAVAAFGGILRVLSVGLESTRWEWRGVLWGVAIVSMIIGAVLGLTQTDIKRMIAYSSVAHAGFLLIGAIVLMYFSEPAPDGPTVTVPGAFTTAAITLGVVVTLLLGLIPAFALDWANAGNFALQ
jgi:NADH:ubiquinone oxidoreductase subunit 2 (subunit N)